VFRIFKESLIYYYYDIVKSSMKNHSVTYRKTMKTLPLEGGGRGEIIFDKTTTTKRRLK